jgi:hypothetical protein
MKNTDQSLDRLLRAAARHRPAGESPAEPPFGFTTRVVAGWLAGRGNGGFAAEARLQVLWFRRAFLCAVAVMAVSVGWSFKIDTSVPNDESAVASYDATADLP